MSTDQIIDDVLPRFAALGPEFGPGLANHGPMAAEALIALGRADVVEEWCEWYAPRLGDPPRSRNPIASADWREALGDIARAGDWSAFFSRELAQHPWRDALETWVPRLGPGIMAGATHGVLRIAHAVRSLDRGESPQRVEELALGLAYWAARYQELPAAQPGAGSLGVTDALLRVDRVADEARTRGMIFNSVKAVDTTDFAPVINLVSINGEIDVFVQDITRTFVRQYLANASTASVAFVHTVTAPSALRILVPHLSDGAARATMRYAWQACASIYATFGRSAPQPLPALDDPTPVDIADLIDQAVAARDEHAIKFTEACLREYALSPDPAFIAAVEDVVTRLRAPA